MKKFAFAILLLTSLSFAQEYQLNYAVELYIGVINVPVNQTVTVYLTAVSTVWERNNFGDSRYWPNHNFTTTHSYDDTYY